MTSTSRLYQVKPTIGRIVIYTLPTGTASPTIYNNGATEAPAVVVRVFDDGKINLKVLLDAPGEHWATSVVEGTGPNTWHWPARA
jgi:hypothetical protein